MIPLKIPLTEGNKFPNAFSSLDRFCLTSSWILDIKSDGIFVFCVGLVFMYLVNVSLHKKLSFPLRISSLNVTKLDLVTFTEKILNDKLHFLRSVLVD